MQTYTIKPTSAEEFYAAFPAQALKIQGEPSYDDIRQLRMVIYQNAASIHSNLGGGLHGHLGMVMDDNTYATLTNQPWVDPPEPPAVVPLPNAPTAPQIAEAHRAHSQELKIRREFQNLDRALTRIIIESIEALYLKPFHQPYIGLLGQSTKDILQKLIDAYGHILPHELERNYAQLAKPYDATQEPLQILIERFEDARTYAADGNLPITDAQLINSGLVALKNTGVLDRFVDQWTDKPVANRSTWLQFKQHFQPRVLEYQKGRRGNQDGVHAQFGLMASGHTSLTSDTSTISSVTSFQEALAQANNAAMANMAATQTELLKQLADMQEKFATLAASAQQLQTTQDTTTPVRRNGRRRNPTTSTTNNNRPRNRDPNGYCWTHGYRVTYGHNSTTCHTRAPGHKESATRDNNMGGSQAGKET